MVGEARQDPDFLLVEETLQLALLSNNHRNV